MGQRVSGTFSGNGDSASLKVPEDKGGYAVLSIAGTWRSCTVTLYCRPAGGDTFRSMEDGAWTANADQEIRVMAGAQYKLTLSGAGSPIPDLDYSLQLDDGS